MLVSIETKKQLLTALYEAYDEAAGEFSSACIRQCAVCCTHNVVGTSLEAYMVLDRLEETGRSDVIQAMGARPSVGRLRPALSINALAACCLRRIDPPEEDTEIERSPCPIRGEDGCECYEARPLGCRCLWSEKLCTPDGEALMHPLIVTINGAFQQIAEHLDPGGLYGNLSDLVTVLADPEIRSAYQSGSALEAGHHLHRTLPSPGFLVPPEHRNAVARVLSRLWGKKLAM